MKKKEKGRGRLAKEEGWRQVEKSRKCEQGGTRRLLKLASSYARQLLRVILATTRKLRACCSESEVEEKEKEKGQKGVAGRMPHAFL